MNTEDSEFERIEREQAMRSVPDPIHHTDPAETLEYITGWNDCRAAMLAQPEHHDPIGVAQDRLIAEQALAHCEAGPEYCQQCYKEAMKLALKALEPFTTPNWAGTGVDAANAAYTALQGALAKQPAQQELVAWGKPTDEMVQAATDEYDEWANENKGTTECIRAMLAKALKASPQAQPASDFVWLTNEEIKELKNLPGANRERTATEMAFAVRDKLMEKTT